MIFPKEIFSPAKININLHIIKKLKNNYHELDSIIVFTKNFGDKIIINSTSDNFILNINSKHNINLGNYKNNLIYKTAKILGEFYNKPYNFDIILEKNIPVGAGLGGGSGNAASFAKFFIKYHKIGFNFNELSKLLTPIGADIAMFLIAKPLRARGIGEIINKINLDKKYIVIIYPNIHIKTSEIYNSEIDFLTEIKEVSYQYGKNSLLKPAIKKHPIIKEIIQQIESTNPIKSGMSGSGSSCFGIYENKEQAKKAQKLLENNNFFVIMDEV